MRPGRPLRLLLVAAGTLSLVLGVVGIFVPLLPTTPFLVLSAALYMRSSDRLYGWLVTNRVTGRYISNYRRRRGMTPRHKALTLALLWASLGCSAAFATRSTAVRLVLAGVGVAVTLHVLLLRTCRDTPPQRA